MASILRRNDDHLLVQYRAERSRDSKKLYWRCPDEETFKKFCAVEDTHKKAGTPVPDPATLFGEVPKSLGKKAAKRAQATAEKKARAEQRAAAAASRPMFSAAEWVGQPKKGKPGRYFQHANAMEDGQKRRYESLLRNYGAHFKDKPMDRVTVDDARVMMQKMISCDACRRRAIVARRKDLLAEGHVRFDSTKQPWDGAGACVDDDGESTHFSGNKRDTVAANLWLMRTLWRVAMEAAADGNEPQFEKLKSKPFEKVGANVPNVPEQTTNDDLAESLSHTQLDMLRLGFPDWLRASVRTGAYGLMRRSEFLGLERGMIVWPTLPEHYGQAVIQVTHTYAADSRNPRVAVRRPWGKNAHSTREPIYLAAIATAELREHVLTFRSTPNPKVCAACREGQGEHTGSTKTNQHRGCDFSNDAPIWWDPTREERVTPHEYSGTWFARAALAAGLTVSAVGFKPTPKLLRATGATLLIDSGVPIEQVAHMGRWKNVDVLRKHYHRMREESKAQAARSLDWAARGELGLPGTEEASLEDRVRFLDRRVDVLAAETARYRQILADLGVDLDELDAVEPATVRTLDVRRAESPLADIDRIRELAATCANRLEIIEALGMTSTSIPRLAEVAKEHGIELPKPWQRTAEKAPPKSVLDDLTEERLRQLANLPTLTAILAAVGAPMQKSYREQLQAKASEWGIELPELRPKTPKDHSAFDDDETLRFLVENQPTRLAILRSLGFPKPSPTEYALLERRAGELGLQLPDKVNGRPRKEDAVDHFADDDKIVEAVKTKTSQTGILAFLGIRYPTVRQYEQLTEHAARLGLELPAKRNGVEQTDRQAHTTPSSQTASAA